MNENYKKEVRTQALRLMHRLRTIMQLYELGDEDFRADRVEVDHDEHFESALVRITTPQGWVTLSITERAKKDNQNG
jgi:hypothetical protein